jgi:hypothetical protein
MTDDGGDADCGVEGQGKAIISGGDPAEVLEATEYPAEIRARLEKLPLTAPLSKPQCDRTGRRPVAKKSALARTELSMVRLRLVETAARVVGGAVRFRLCLPDNLPEARVFRLLAGCFATVGP